MTQKLLLIILLFLPLAANAQEIKAKPGDTIVAESGSKKSLLLQVVAGMKNTPSINFLIKEGDVYSPAPAGGVAYDDIFVVQLSFTQPQSETTYYVDINWNGASSPYEVRLERTDNVGKFYRSPDLRAQYMDGPGVERVVDQEGQ